MAIPETVYSDWGGGQVGGGYENKRFLKQAPYIIRKHPRDATTTVRPVIAPRIS